MLPLGGTDNQRGKTDSMTTGKQIVAEIGLLLYPDVQLAAVYGLTDLFRIAGEMSQASGGPESPAIRVSHWRQEASSAGVECVFDSHPDPTHDPSHLIAPPSLIMPAKMQPMNGLASWLAERHDAGTTLCSVCAGAFLLGEAGLLEGPRRRRIGPSLGSWRRAFQPRRSILTAW